jgi:hypothetical protein
MDKSSVSRISRISALLFNPAMATTDEIRRERLHLLKKEAGGVRELTEKLERSYSQVSQWLNGSKDSKSGKPRAIASKTARWIEAKLGKEEGWMDQPTEQKKLSLPSADQFIENIEAIPPSFQAHVVKVAADLRRRWEAIPKDLRYAISAPPENQADYKAWENSIDRLIEQGKVKH